MESKNLINPFKLLGINYYSSNSELKRAYYNLALLCHPDKGGSKDDMDIIAKAYQYTKQQINNKTDKTYEELQNEFDEFCKAQQNQKPVSFASIYEETNDWIVDFNKTFEQQNQKEDASSNPYSIKNGYGNLMAKSNNNIDKIIETDCKYIPDIESELSEIEPFSTEIIEYKEPISLNTFNDNGFPLDKKHIDDFTSINNIDYKKAFSEPEHLEFNVDKYNYNVIDEFERLKTLRNNNHDMDNIHLS